jgi:hypothetical protein
VTWVESASRSFRARHDAAIRDDAERVLGSLEEAREQLAGYFPASLAGLTVVLHDSGASLSLARPVVPLVWLATEPRARCYVAGWAGRHELHMLVPGAALERCPAGVPGSEEMLALTAPALYARRVVGENNRDLLRRSAPGRVRAQLRWAWMLEGAARWFSGQTGRARPAIARRLRDGPPPSFPPGIRDASLLGGTVIDLLAREQGDQAAVRFVSRLDPRGPRAALNKAFGGRPIVRTEEAWRSQLKRLARTSYPTS